MTEDDRAKRKVGTAMHLLGIPCVKCRECLDCYGADRCPVTADGVHVVEKRFADLGPWANVRILAQEVMP